MKISEPVRLIGILCAPLLLAAVVFAPSAFAPRPPRVLKVTVIDVGQGDSILIETPGGRTMLIDGGPASPEENGAREHDAGAAIVLPFLRHEGIRRVDIVALTHPHADHSGGLATVVRAMPVGIVLDGSVLDDPDPVYLAFRDAVSRRSVCIDAAREGQKMDLGDGVSVECLNPPVLGRPYGVDLGNDTVNNYSSVYRLTYGRVHFLFDGDAEEDAEKRMISAGQTLRADVLKCGHHGANNATSNEWLDAVRPSIALISCGAHNRYGHPGRHTLARLDSRGIKTFITARDGAITLTTDGNAITATAERLDK